MLINFLDGLINWLVVLALCSMVFWLIVKRPASFTSKACDFRACNCHEETSGPLRLPSL
jgi:hypothetical protein